MSPEAGPPGAWSQRSPFKRGCPDPLRRHQIVEDRKARAATTLPLRRRALIATFGGAVKAGEGRCAPTRPSLFLTCSDFPAVAFLTPAHPVDRETGVTPAPCQPNHLRCAQLTRQGTRADPRGPAGRYGRR